MLTTFEPVERDEPTLTCQYDINLLKTTKHQMLMKKVFALVIALFLAASFAPAFAQSYQKSNNLLNAGIGLSAYGAGGLPIGISFEKGITDQISVGGFADYSRYGYNSGGYKWNYTFIYAGARGSYHLGELLNMDNNKFDPYAGASLGFRSASYRDNTGYNYNDYVSPYNSGLFFGIHVGGRYYFSEKLGAFGEVGYGVSALKLGLTAKF
jgi:hypothetical protein